MNPHRLYRSSDDRWIGGVAAGVADYFDVDPVLVRVLWLISIPLTAGTSVLAYLIMLIVVPQAPGEWPQPSPWAPGGAPVGGAPVGGAPLGYAANYTPPPGATDQGTPPAAGQAPDTGGGAAPTGYDPAAGTTPGYTPPPGSAPFAGPVPPTQGTDWRWARRQERWQRRADRWERRGERAGSGGIVFGALLIVVGGLIAWHEIDPRLDLNLAWPIAIVLFGAFLVVSSLGIRKGGDS